MKDSLKKLTEAKKQLKKLTSLSGVNSNEYSTFTITGDSIPEVWCPEVRAKIRPGDLPNIESEKIINVNGGTP